MNKISLSFLFGLSLCVGIWLTEFATTQAAPQNNSGPRLSWKLQGRIYSTNLYIIRDNNSGAEYMMAITNGSVGLTVTPLEKPR